MVWHLLLLLLLAIGCSCDKSGESGQCEVDADGKEVCPGTKVEKIVLLDMWTFAKGSVLGMEPIDVKTREDRFRSNDYVLDWHFSMVNDWKRNNAYARAIEKAVKKDSIVLDIGTGGGLLSLLAARAGAKKVYTVDFEKPLVRAAAEIFKHNGFNPHVIINDKEPGDEKYEEGNPPKEEAKITLFHNISSNLTIPEDIPQRATVLVSEIVDSVLIGEVMLPAYDHALQHLITPDAVVIPKRGMLWVLAVEAKEYRDEVHLADDAFVEGLDFSALQSRATSSYRTNATVARKVNYRSLSNDEEFAEFDFTSVKQMGMKRPVFKEIHVKITSSGILDGLLCWFDMWLDDEIVISTNPDFGWAHENHWQQMAFKVKPITVEAGDVAHFLVAEHNTFYQVDLLRVMR